jgi:hypothetical protein
MIAKLRVGCKVLDVFLVSCGELFGPVLHPAITSVTHSVINKINCHFCVRTIKRFIKMRIRLWVKLPFRIVYNRAENQNEKQRHLVNWQCQHKFLRGFVATM